MTMTLSPSDDSTPTERRTSPVTGNSARRAAVDFLHDVHQPLSSTIILAYVFGSSSPVLDPTMSMSRPPMLTFQSFSGMEPPGRASDFNAEARRPGSGPRHGHDHGVVHQRLARGDVLHVRVERHQLGRLALHGSAGLDVRVHSRQLLKLPRPDDQYLAASVCRSGSPAFLRPWNPQREAACVVWQIRASSHSMPSAVHRLTSGRSAWSARIRDDAWRVLDGRPRTSSAPFPMRSPRSSLLAVEVEVAVVRGCVDHPLRVADAPNQTMNGP